MASTEQSSADHELAWYRSLPMLLDMATAARERAVSHRQIPFKVGAAALIYSPVEKSYGYLDGANYKPHPEGPRKCAEEEILAAAKDLGVKIIGVVVIAPHQPDDHTGIDLGATPCCTFCRKRLRKEVKEEEPLITTDAYFLFVNADVPTKRVELSMQRMFDIFNGEH